MVNRSVGQFLKDAGQLLSSSGQLAALEMQVLLEDILGVSRASLLSEPSRDLSSEEAMELRRRLERREAGEPIAYILGRKEFYGREFRVSPDVLIPRPETELLCEIAVGVLNQSSRVLEIGTGSGCIAITLALEIGCEIFAGDLSLPALELARANAVAQGCEQRIRFFASDLFGAVSKELPEAMKFDCVVSNPPYVAIGDDVSPGCSFEPRQALFSGADGLDAIRKLLLVSGAFLGKGGRLILEHGSRQRESIEEICADSDCVFVRTVKDLAGLDRVSEIRF